MKKMLLIVMTVVIVTSCSTMLGDKVEGEIEYTEIMEFEGLSKDDLFQLASLWMVETFVDSKAVIEIKDKEAGRLAGKYIFSYFEGVYTYDMRSTIVVEVKDNKLRFKCSNPYWTATSGMGKSYNNPYQQLQTQKGAERCQKEWKELADSLNSYIESEKGEADW